MTSATDDAATPPGGSPLFGRDRELRLLNAALQAAHGGEMRALLLTGNAGSGKSRLVREGFALAREQAVRFASGSAYEGDSGRPFGPIVDLLRAARRGGREPDERAAFQEALGAFADAGDGDAAVSRWAQIDGVVDALAAAAEAERPLRVVAFEDLHWADASTLELLTQIVRQLEPLPLVVLASFRPPSTGAVPLLSFVEAARALPESERLELEPIAAGAAAELVRATALGLSDEAVETIVERAAGNPLFLEEAARDAGRTAQAGGTEVAQARVPGAIRDLVQQRVARLPEQAREVLAAFAVLGDDHDPAIVGSVLDLTPTAIGPSLGALTAEELLAPDADGRLSFRHDLARDAVYDSIPALRRRELHARCVDAIEAHEGERAAAAMAEHLQRVGGVEQIHRAGTLLARAGEQSLNRLAYEQAASQLGDAVRLLLECDEDAALVRQARLRLAEALRRTHPDDAALDTYATLADEAAAAGDTATEAQAAVGYEQTYLETGRARSGVAARSIPLLDRALAHLEGLAGVDAGPLRARVLAAGAQARHFAGERDASLAMARRAADAAHEASVPGAEAAALNTLRLATAGPDAPEETLELTRRIVERAAEASEFDLELDGLLWRIIALLETGQRTESEATLARFATLAERVRHPWRLSELHRMQAMFAHLNGDFETARAEIETALRFGLAAGHAEARSPYVVMLATIGSPAEIREAVEALLAQRTPELTTFRWQTFVGWLALIAGDRDRARRLGAMAMESGLETLPRDQSWFTFLQPFAELAIELNQPDWAEVTSDALLPYADRYLVSANGAICFGSVERLLARLAEVSHSDDAAARHRRAAERNEAIGARAWLPSATAGPTRVTKTFMFTDIVGSTDFAELLGDEAWGTLLRWHDETLGALFREYEGEQVVSTGDGFFVAFDDPGHAIGCARAVQRRLAEHRQTTGFAPEVRIGLHAAEANREAHNYHGRGVHEAARISALAGGGQIFASASTAGDEAEPGTARLVSLKGIAEPMEIVDIAWR